MNNNFFLLCGITVALIAWATVRVSSEIADVKLAKHGKLTVLNNDHCGGNCGVYDLYEFTNWLEEKGAVREGFGVEHLIEDYING